MDSNDLKEENKNGDIYLTPKDHTQTIIFLHGLGDAPSSYVPDFKQSPGPIPPKTKVILLSAPKVKIPEMGNIESTSWFNLSLFFGDEKGVADMETAFIRISKIIEEEATLLKGQYNKIFIGGFSQGACISFHVGLLFKHELGGIMPLSGVLFPQTLKLVDLKSKENLHCFIASGLQDDKIQFEQAKLTFEPILKLKNVEFHTYPIGHTIIGDEYTDMRKFLDKCLDNK